LWRKFASFGSSWNHRLEREVLSRRQEFSVAVGVLRERFGRDLDATSRQLRIAWNRWPIAPSLIGLIIS
jgi:hypothetical protein